jgi:hypothetical protein
MPESIVYESIGKALNRKGQAQISINGGDKVIIK